MPPRPLSKAHGLAKRLARMATADAIDEFALRRIEADAEKLMGTDAAGAHLALARVAALRWDFDEMTRRHELALTLRDSAFTRCDYSSSLTLVGEIDEAFEIAREARTRAPDDLMVLRHAIEAAVQGAQFREAQTLCDRWSKLSPHKAMPLQPGIAALTAAVEHGAFTEAGARDALRSAAAIRRDAHIRCSGFSIQPSVEDPGSFGFKYDLIASPDDAGDLNYALAQRWADSTRLQADPGLAFVPVFIGTVDGSDA